MDTSMSVVPMRTLTPDLWEMISTVAPAVHAGRLFGMANPEAAMTVMMIGAELGLSLTASFEFVQIVQGKPTLSPRGMLALITRSGLCEEMKIEDLKDDKGTPKSCRVMMKRKGGMSYTVEFSMDDARRAGVVRDGSGWATYPANMLRWRALGFCADVVFPDVLCGMKRADELGADLAQDGSVIEGSWREVRAQSAPQPVPATSETPKPGMTLADLVAQYPDPQQILDANGGRIPGTNEEVAAVAEKLATNG